VFARERWTLRRVSSFAARFTWLQLQSLVFAIIIFAAIAVTSVVTLPIPRYDALLIIGVALTLGLWAAGWESGREVAVICAFHLLGVTMEIFKVHAGSWDYPGDAFTKVAGVPLYAGFMYAAVGSYIVQAWRRLELRVSHYRPIPLTILAVAAYLNFFTHHWIWDLRWLIAALFLVEMRRTMVHFTVGTHRYFMPLSVSFVAIGFALWLAENLATFLGAWQYPNQAEIWESVHVGKFGSWSLLVSLSFALVATIKRFEGQLYGVRGRRPDVQVDQARVEAVPPLRLPQPGAADADPA
jgi:uncharacterized membrane protein YoaT (DUF817 family)